MSFLTGLGKTQAAQQAAVSGLQLQSSAYGKCVPIVYGTTRLAPNLIWYGDFSATQQSAGSAGKGGVGGGGGGKSGGGQYVYSTSFEMALCEGPIQGIGDVYVDKNVTTLEALGISLFTGEYGQAPWSHLVTPAQGVSESQTIPASAPYTVTVSQAASFMQDGSVVASVDTRFTAVAGIPSLNQYTVIKTFDAALYTFDASGAGLTVAISYTDSGAYNTISRMVPVTAPYQVLVPSQGIMFADLGVTSTGTAFVSVPAAPASNQYAESAGVYTFSAANAGQPLVLTYYLYPATGEALGYSGIAYTAAANYALGSNAQLPNHNFEVEGVASDSLADLGVPDADPSVVVADLLTNPHYGIGFPSARLGDLSAYQSYCVASGLWISPAYTDQRQSSSLLDDIALATNSAFVWSGGALTLVPYGDAAVNANGYAYAPPSSPLYDLTDDDFMSNTQATGGSASSNDPVLMTRKRQSDAYNAVKLECIDRGNAYNPAIVEAQDQALIENFGLRAASVSQMHLFADVEAARLSAQLQLQRQAIRNIYQFTLDQRFALLDPMDIVTITDTALGLNRQWVRVTEITENDDGSLSVTAEEYLSGAASAAQYSFQQGQGFNADYNASPGNANAPVMFEPTAELSEKLEVWIAVSGGENWGGCDVYISNDDSSYKYAGRITGSARTGLLGAPLAAVTQAATGQTIDMANTLCVDLSQSGGQLFSGTLADATSLTTLCYVDGEFIAYETASLTGNGVYNLGYLVRDAYGSGIASHAAGSAFARLDDSIFTFPFTQDFIGSTIYIKLAGFNLYNGGLQNLSDLQPYAYTLRGTAFSSPLPQVKNLRTSYVANITQLAWDEISDLRPVEYEIRLGAQWSGAQVLGRIAHPPFSVQGNGTYWVSCYSQPLAGMQVYSEEPESILIGGAQIVSNVIAAYDEAATGWGGGFGGEAILIGSDVYTTGAGDVLSDPDYLGTPDIFTYGSGGAGSYTIPAVHEVNIGRVAPCSVIISWDAIGQHSADNILIVPDYLGDPDILDYAASTNINVYPEIALSPDGTTWGAWQKYAAGTYNAMAFNARMIMDVYDPTVIAILSSFVFEVDVPDRDDHYVNLSIDSGGTAITFTPDGAATPAPFNGGPQGSPSTPSVQVTILDAVQGDTVVVSSVSLSGCTVQILSGGVGVSRNVNILAEGY